MDGVQSHTMTLWRLLERYEIPVFLFVNKMDQQGTDHDALLRDLRKRLNENCMDFACLTEDNSERAVGDDKTESMKSGTDTSEDLDDLMENLAMCEEELLETYLETGEVAHREICRLIVQRKVFPCWFGSALKMQGVQEFLQGLESYTMERAYSGNLGQEYLRSPEILRECGLPI